MSRQENDHISREAAIDAMWELQGRAGSKGELVGISKAWKRIEKLPSAQPEVIRCKDCKHFHENVWGNEIGLDNWPIIVAHEACDAWGKEWTQSSADGYCHMAERRTDG